MDNSRAQSARDHDDSAIIDAAEGAPGQGSSAGGNLARDVASRDEIAQAIDPDSTTGVNKQNDQDNGISYRAQRAPGG